MVSFMHRGPDVNKTYGTAICIDDTPTENYSHG